MSASPLWISRCINCASIGAVVARLLGLFPFDGAQWMGSGKRRVGDARGGLLTGWRWVCGGLATGSDGLVAESWVLQWRVGDVCVVGWYWGDGEAAALQWVGD